jgi:hypothetical protein
MGGKSQQRVVINGSNSNWLPIRAGVPQSSILGPLSFIRVEFYEPFFRPTLYLIGILVQEESRVAGVVNNEI